MEALIFGLRLFTSLKKVRVFTLMRKNCFNATCNVCSLTCLNTACMHGVNYRQTPLHFTLTDTMERTRTR